MASEAGGPSIIRTIAAVIIAAALGFFAQSGVLTYRDQTPIGVASQERYRVPPGNTRVKGPSDAKVTIVEYADLQSPPRRRSVSAGA